MYGTKQTDYFESVTKGEMFEIRKQLNHANQSTVTEGVKKVIKKMSEGEDVSEVFPDVIKSLSTRNLELKKLVYLYTIHHAHKHPKKAILLVNTFQKDAKEHPNALIRSLSIRAMGCIGVQNITEYLCDPLSEALNDKDPYVRKTAVICVAKLFEINKESVKERGFLERLLGKLSDSNPVVVSNTVASLMEIAKSDPTVLKSVNYRNCRRLAAALGECTEWGQTFILDLLAECSKKVAFKDAVYIAERVLPHLSHSNPAVVFAAIKTIVELPLENSESEKYLAKVKPALITLMSSRPELQYIILRNIKLLLEKFPNLLEKDLRVLFCKYNDPPFIKKEKIDLLLLAATEKNAEQILLEFDDYSKEVDIEFSKISVAAIGELAIKVKSIFDYCINALRSLMLLKRGHILNQVLIALKNITLNRQINQADAVEVFCENIEMIDTAESKEALIWLFGVNFDKLGSEKIHFLNAFIDNFYSESEIVKYQLLTTSIRCYSKKPCKITKTFCENVTKLCETEENSLDLKDRVKYYKNLVFSDILIAKKKLSSNPNSILKTNEKQKNKNKNGPKISKLSNLSSTAPKKNLDKNRKTINLAVQLSKINELKSKGLKNEEIQRHFFNFEQNGQKIDENNDENSEKNKKSPNLAKIGENSNEIENDVDLIDLSKLDNVTPAITNNSEETLDLLCFNDKFNVENNPKKSENNEKNTNITKNIENIQNFDKKSENYPKTDNFLDDDLLSFPTKIENKNLKLDELNEKLDELKLEAKEKLIENKNWTRLLNATTSGGLQLDGAFSSGEKRPTLFLRLENRGDKVLERFSLRFGKNKSRIKLKDSLKLSAPLKPFEKEVVELEVEGDKRVLEGEGEEKIQVGLKSELPVAVQYFDLILSAGRLVGALGEE